MKPYHPSEQATQVLQLFDELIGLAPEARSARLYQEDNPEVRAEVEALLQADGQADKVLHELDQGVEIAPENLATDPLIGRCVGRYRIEEKLGGGGMGVVYRTRDTRLDRAVALKFLPPHLSLDDEAKARFIHEAKAASALDDPNIGTVYDIDETREGRLFIVMAFYSGESVKAKIARGPLPVAEAIVYAEQMAEGLHRAHDAGIVHRDVKPANVMVTERGRVKLVDFGLAKVQDVNLTQTGITLGTAAYMSPEQARGDDVDQRTDLWALGVMLYEMLAGERPFRGSSEQAIIYQLLNRDPEPITRIDRDLPEDVTLIVSNCLQKDRDDRYATASLLLTDLRRVRRALFAGDSLSHRPYSPPMARDAAYVDRARICISYNRGEALDEQVARAIYDALRRHHDFFMDISSPVGSRWIEQIEAELAQSDYLIVLLSARSIHSEMVLAEIETVNRLARERGGRPGLLPVRLRYTQPFAYPLNAYLDEIPCAFWESEADTPRLIEQLSRAVAGGALSTSMHAKSRPLDDHKPEAIPEPLAAAQPHLETPEGTMDPHSIFYVHRPQDDLARRAMARQGVTLTIKGPRQMGKSSLLVRAMNAAVRSGKKVVFLDFQLFNQSALNEADTFFKQFCVWLTIKLKLKNRVEEYWQWPLGNSQCCTLYVEDCILGAVDRPLVLAMDEVERVFDTGFRSDFFGMLRSWHNDRAIASVWKRLDLALVTSTEPYQLIENLNQSPFNVGEIIEMNDFTPAEVAELNDKHGGPLTTTEIGELIELLGGHPYLTRRALYLVSSGQFTMHALLASAARDRGPFGDHLRYHLFRLQGQDDLIQGLREIIQRQQCHHESVFWRLQGAGLVQREGRAVVTRCRLYDEYFRDHFDG